MRKAKSISLWPEARFDFADTRTPVDDSYKLPFRFTGTINKVTYKIGREQLAADDRKVMQKALAGAHD